MTGPLQFGICPSYVAEFQTALRELGLEEVGVQVLQTTCLGGRPVGAVAPPPGTRLNVVCSRPPADGPVPGEELVPVEQCFHLLAGKTLVDSLQQGGAYVATPGWILQWRARLAAWGFDQRLASEFFGEAMTEVAFLDTGVHPGAALKAAEFAAFVGLPLRTIPVGLDHLKSELSRLVGQWRLRREEARNQTRLAASQERLAELSMAVELLRDLSGAVNEDEATQRILELLCALFAPREVIFLSFRQGAPHQIRPEATPAAVRAQLSSFQGDVEWLGADSFVFRLATRGETVAVVRVDQVAFPARREDYLNLAHSIAELCAAALVGARNAMRQRQVELELRQSHKLESVGRLAAGIAHEINTPVQFVGDNIAFVLDGLKAVQGAAELSRALCARVEQGTATPADARELREKVAQLDLEFILQNAPQALRQSAEGLSRISTIVRSMQEFAHPLNAEQEFADLNRALTSTLEVARNEYKYVAEVKLELGEVPLVLCYPGELNQVFLNLLVNAAHAIEPTVKGTGGRGLITVRSKLEGEQVVIAIQDTGTGIPLEARDHVFEQFFTTREVGKGTGQGLSVAWQVVERHGGTVSFDTEPGVGTTFFVRLPTRQPGQEPA